MALALDVEALKTERDQCKAQLRELEIEQRKIEAEIKTLRQKEIRAKREIEALSTLIELNEAKPEAAEPPAEPPAG